MGFSPSTIRDLMRLVVGVLFVTLNLGADALYRVFDPRATS